MIVRPLIINPVPCAAIERGNIGPEFSKYLVEIICPVELISQIINLESGADGGLTGRTFTPSGLIVGAGVGAAAGVAEGVATEVGFGLCDDPTTQKFPCLSPIIAVATSSCAPPKRVSHKRFPVASSPAIKPSVPPSDCDVIQALVALLDSTVPARMIADGESAIALTWSPVPPVRFEKVTGVAGIIFSGTDFTFVAASTGIGSATKATTIAEKNLVRVTLIPENDRAQRSWRASQSQIVVNQKILLARPRLCR